MSKFFLKVVIFILCALPRLGFAEAAIGINLGAVLDWSSEWVFQDAFKHSRPWLVRYSNRSTPGGHETEQLDEDGWPRYLHHNQWMETLLYREIEGRYPAGHYVVLYEGIGELSFHFDAQIQQSSPGRIDLFVRPSHGGILMRIRSTDLDEPIRNIRIMHADALESYETQPFHPLFLERLEPYTVIRFMDWQRTNNSPIVQWKQRAKPQDATQATHKGVAIEHAIELCNISEKDPWLCIPHGVDDDYIRQMAQLVKSQLDPNRRIYIEYSNEVWNGIFKQAHYAQSKGLELGLSSNAFEAQLRYYSQRSQEAFSIWEEVFDGSKRLVRVLSSQAANPWSSETILSWKDAYKHADALAIAPYYGGDLGTPQRADEVLSQNSDQIFEELEQGIKANASLIASHNELAKRYGLELISYEGGQHLAGHGGTENLPELVDRFTRANRDPRMRDLYLKDHKSWSSNGGGLFMYYHSISRPSKWGCWGLLEHQSQELDSAPKYQAILEISHGEGG